MDSQWFCLTVGFDGGQETMTWRTLALDADQAKRFFHYDVLADRPELGKPIFLRVVPCGRQD